MVDNVVVSFSGISKCKIQLFDSSNILYIDGFVNSLGENMDSSRLPIDFENKDTQDIFICVIVNKFEEQIAKWIKENIKKMVPKFFKNPYSFLDNWKYVTSNDSIFQVILLLSNLAFSHDLTCILGIQNKSQPNLLEHLKSFCAYLEENLKLFCEAMRGKNTQAYPKNPFYLQSQYVLLLRYHCDILKRFID